MMVLHTNRTDATQAEIAFMRQLSRETLFERAVDWVRTAEKNLQLNLELQRRFEATAQRWEVALRDANAAKNEWVRKYDALYATRSASGEQVNSLKSENQQLRVAVEELQAQAKELQSQLDAVRQELNEAKNYRAYRNSKVRASALATDTEALVRENSRLKRRVTERDRENDYEMFSIGVHDGLTSRTLKHWLPESLAELDYA